MKIALVTTWDERCGIAEYAKDLVESSDGVEWDIIGRPFDINRALQSDAPIVHVNHEPGLFSNWDHISVNRLKAVGKKTVCTWHTSSYDNRNGFTSAFDTVVVHEDTTDGFIHIPHGIYDWNGPVESKDAVATAGFPFPWKGFHQVAEAARDLGIGFRAMIPESPHGDANRFKNELLSIHTGAEIRTDWAPKSEVVPWLAECKVQAYCYHGANGGISGAVRLGLATGRATVISQCRQFRDLLEHYSEEVFTLSQINGNEIRNRIDEALKKDIRPTRILKDMSWKRCAGLYKQVYESLL